MDDETMMGQTSGGKQEDLALADKGDSLFVGYRHLPMMENLLQCAWGLSGVRNGFRVGF